MTRNSPKEVVAAFDFDGTITYCDSLMPFLYFVVGPWCWLVNMFYLIPIFFGYLAGRFSRHQVKEHVLTRFLKGMPFIQIRDFGRAFASKKLQRLVKPKAWKRLLWHQSQGHRCILISASIDTYLGPWAKAADFQDVICSTLESSADGFVTGKLWGDNCRGPEKTRRLEELLGPRENYLLYAYGDSEGDKELLQYADFPFYKKMPDEEES